MRWEIVRNLYWDIKSDRKAYYLEYVIRNLPSEFGVKIRERWYNKRFKKTGSNLRILPGVFILNPQLIECGDNVSFGVNSYVQAGGHLYMGDDVLIGPFAKIWTQNHDYSNPNLPIWKQEYKNKAVKIGNDVWIGSNSFIMPGVNLRNKCIVSACSVVGSKEYLEGTILAGNPARKIGERQ